MQEIQEVSRFGEMSITDKTAKAYIKRAYQLYQKALKENRRMADEDYKFLVCYLLDNRVNYTSSTFRQYKSAVVYWLWEVIKTNSSREAAYFLATQTSDGTVKNSTNTSAKKKKHIPSRQYEKIIKHLEFLQTKWARPTLLFIKAGILTGLRPAEWEHAELLEMNGEMILKVQNGKSTNGRSNGEYRQLRFLDVSEKEMDELEEHLDSINQHLSRGLKFEGYYVKCSETLRKSNIDLFKGDKKRITLYSCRHQFSANAKASEIPPSHVSAMMGHAVTSTAQRHYGKKNYGHTGGLKVQPNLDEAAKVRENAPTQFRPSNEPGMENIHTPKTPSQN